jgi:hypothetical protein
MLAHRWAWENVKTAKHTPKPIQAGFEVAQTVCGNVRCVNPDHCTSQQHFSANARKTECKYGHKLEGHNLKVRPDGRRRCRRCDNVRSRRYEKQAAAEARKLRGAAPAISVELAKMTPEQRAARRAVLKGLLPSGETPSGET